MRIFILILWTGASCCLVSCNGASQPVYARGLPPHFGGRVGNATEQAGVAGKVQAQINSAGPGGRVVVGPGVYRLDSALHPQDGTVIDCAGGQILGNAGVVFKPVGRIWALENPDPPRAGLNSVTVMNCVFDLSQDPDALGALNLRAIAFSKFYNVTIVLPARGNMEAVRFDGQDSNSKIPAYWNDFYSPNIYALGHGRSNSHIGFHFINGANDEHIFGGVVERVSNAFLLHGSDGSLVAGTGAEDFSRCIDLAGTAMDGPNHVSANTFLNVRCESRVPGNVAIEISASSYNNQILFPHSFATMSAASHLHDLSNGRNTVEYSVKNSVIYTIGGLGNDVRLGINKAAASPGVDIHGDLSADGHWKIGSGIDGNSPGFKAVRGETCDTKAQVGATCSYRLDWSSPFKDRSYTVTCTFAKAHGRPFIIATNPDPSGLDISVASAADAVSGGLVNCIGVHD